MYLITLVSSEDACLALSSKAGKLGSGKERFVPGTEKDANENNQKETQAKEISGIYENLIKGTVG